MPSAREAFFKNSRFAVIGNSSRHPFPKLTYGGLKDLGKAVYAIDVAGAAVGGDPSYRDLGALPQAVDAVILELPPEETAQWVRAALASGIRRIWIHDGTETDDALRLARDAGAECFAGTCAVMYLIPNKFPHNFHRWIMQRLQKY